MKMNWRGGQVTRIEALSDAVFGFAIALLVVSLEVPGDFDSLLALLRGVPAFAASFAVLIMVWIYHYKFFKRYDLDDGYTIFLNSTLLFVVLLYVYPLKFVFMAWLARDTGVITGIENWADLRLMFAVYGAGYCLVFLVFALLHHHAWRLRERMELTSHEVIDARAQLASCLMMVGIGLASVLIALVAPDGFWSILPGPFYVLIGPAQWLVGRRFERLRAALPEPAAALVAAGPASAQ